MPATMENMTTDFIPRLNDFSELMKLNNRLHAEHIVKLGNALKNLRSEYLLLKQQVGEDLKSKEVVNNRALHAEMTQFLAYCTEFEKQSKIFRELFQQSINATNLQLGMISSHWGGYLEQIGVQYMLNVLKKEYGVHTSFQKYKKYWLKNHNVEIDLLALSDKCAYVVEVKNQLKEQTFIQMLTIIDKIRDKFPEYKRLKIQPVFVCIHATDDMVKTAIMGNLWMVRYKGFDRENPEDNFEWLRKDE
jgi:Archaea bacterial proteins of unknown function